MPYEQPCAARTDLLLRGHKQDAQKPKMNVARQVLDLDRCTMGFKL